MQAEHGAGVVVEFFLVVGGQKERCHRSGRTCGRLDHVRDVALVRLRVEVVEPLARRRSMRLEVEVGALCNPFEFVEAPGEVELDIGRACGIVRQLVGVVMPHPQHVGGDAELHVPVEALLAPVLVPLLTVVGMNEELHLHLLELARSKDPVLRGDLVAEALADLGDAERGFLPGGLQDLREVREHALRRLGSQIRVGTGALDRAGLRLEHQVELAGLGEAVLGAALGTPGGIVEPVEAMPRLAVGAVDQWIGEVPEVAGGLPHLRWAEDGGIDQYDIIALLNHGANPCVFHIAQQQRAEWAVVVRGSEAAVDLGRGVDESPAFAEVDDLFELGGRHRRSG